MAEKSKADKVDAHFSNPTTTEEPEEPVRNVSPPPVLHLEVESYNFAHKRRGTCVIINNKEFDARTTGQLPRDGTDIDADAVAVSFGKLGFDIIRYDDLNTIDMTVNLRDIASHDHSEEDCFVCVILSHGEEGVVYGTNGTVPIDRIVNPFKGSRCPTLAGKPKLFFIQACRGRGYDRGVDVKEEEEDVVDADPDTVSVRKIPTEADFLMAYSVIPGHFSWRNNYDGSWFIQALCQVLDRHALEGMELMHMMTLVNKAVAYDFESSTDKQYSTGMKQMPSMVSMLTKMIYFKQKA